MNKFRTFGGIAALSWVINGMEVLNWNLIDARAAVRLHVKIQNRRASLLDCLERSLIVTTIILLITIF